MEEAGADDRGAEAVGVDGGEERRQQTEALREQVYRRALSSDVLSSVKAHLRARLYAELRCSSSSSSIAGSAACWQPLPAPTRSPGLQQHVINCLLADHLLGQGYRYTLSVFLAESGSDTLPRLSTPDMLRLMGVLPETKLHALLAGAGEGGSLAGCRDASGGRPRPPAAGSLAEAVVAALGSLGGHVATRTAACQTHDDGSGPAVAISSGQLVQRLQQIEEEHRRKAHDQEKAAAQTLEQRMAACQRECEARHAAQLQQQLAALRATEVAAAREQEAARCRQQLQEERQALQQAHQERLARLNKQEEELLERRQRAAEEQDQAATELVRRQRAEEDRLTAWRADAEAKVAAAQAAAKQAQQQAEDAGQRAGAQHEEAERRLQQRVAGVEAREAEALRKQATAQAELGSVQDLRRQLAAALEEQGGLRQQLAAAQSLHQEKQAELRLQLEASRRDSERLQAAAAAREAAPGPAEVDRLRRAERQLTQRVETLQGDVAACKAREQLWRACAADTEKLMEKSAQAQDRSLQHGEELRLLLSAAAREVEDLWQQAALAAAAVEGPLAAALQAAGRDARRWQEGATERVEAAAWREDRLRREGAQLQQRALAARTAVAQGLQQLLAGAGHGREPEQWEEDGDSTAEPSPAARHAGLAPAAQQQAGASHSPRLAAGGHASLPDAQAPAQSQQPGQPAQAWPPPPPSFPPQPAAALNFAEQQAQQEERLAQLKAALLAVPKPAVGRTTSAIISAYRARQARMEAGGSGGWQAPAGEQAAGSGAGAAPGAQQRQEQRQGGEPPPGSRLEGDSFYVSDLTSEDSGRF